MAIADLVEGGFPFGVACAIGLSGDSMIGVVIPAHNEEALIDRCLRALAAAIAHPGLAGEQVIVIVVADACTDRTVERATLLGATVIRVEAKNVGVARATGASAALAKGCRWLAFTDADSEVASCWLSKQLASGADAVCGIVSIDDWRGHGSAARAAYEAHYVDGENHNHVHGANLGVSAVAYLKAGGFMPLRSSEDVALVRQLMATGASIARTNTVRVKTSARRFGRAPDGFAGFLRALPGGKCNAAVGEQNLPDRTF